MATATEAATTLPTSWVGKAPTKDQIAEILRLHGAWFRGEAAGTRANLRGANLRGANLYGANLGDANLRGADLYGANLRGANLYGANLRGANLRGANLGDANLRGANLYGANLGDANLRGANLYGANLYGANLYGANLGDANLRGADLYGANLGDANLRGADLYGANLGDETVLPAGFVWREYLEELVPQLLTAGGKKLEEVANQATWDCHSWGDPGEQLACPIATAFSVHTINKVPLLYREQANFFIGMFDAGKIPLDRVLKKSAA